MKKILSVEMMAAYSSLTVYDTGIETPYNQWTDHLIQQGFAWRRGSVLFATIDSTSMSVEVFLSEESNVQLATRRAIRVPFSVGSSASIGISDDTDDHFASVPSGDYSLLFENGLRSDFQLSQQVGELIPSPMWVRLIFTPSVSFQAEILREEPGAEIPLSPIYPLLMEAEPFVI